MLNINVEARGRVAVLRCQGRVVAGDEQAILREAAVPQATNTTLVLDLAQVVGIDAGGLGALLSLRA